MRVVVVSARYPARSRKGDQVRGYAFVEQLAKLHEVVVVSGTPPPSASDGEALGRLARVVVADAGLASRLTAAALATFSGSPVQVPWMLPRRSWRRAVVEAEEADCVLCMTVRSLRGPLPSPMVIDHVDALSRNMALRAKGPEILPVRLFARGEAARLRRFERRAAGWADGQIATSSVDAAALPGSPRTVVIPMAWDGEPFSASADHRRDIDVVFSGDMKYPPNREAAEWISAEVVPLLRRALPGLRPVIVGRSADSLRVKNVEIASDVPDLQAYLRRARVALVPMIGGAGSPIKVLEATSNGAALVARAAALRVYDIPGVVADSASEFADGALRLLEDESARREAVKAAERALSAHASERQAARLEAVLRDAIEASETLAGDDYAHRGGDDL